jgi:MoaA/NifB/PqqE/SkfB family radical SAM enzyme
MINQNNKHSWCVNAEHAISGNNEGTTKICCMISPVDSNGVSYYDPRKIGETPLIEHFNKPQFQEVRDFLKEGKRHPACFNCWNEEDSGRKSKRLRDNDVYQHDIKWDLQKYNGIVKVELNLGNTCNIKCRTCHPAISSGWMREYYEVYEHQNVSSYNDWAEGMKKYYLSYDETSPFWDDIQQHLGTIKQFDFYGGEPFLSKKMWQLLKIAADSGVAKNIGLHYNTNGTMWPTRDIESWKDFKSINLSFSIDGIGDQFEYMRFPAKWQDLKTNINNARQYRDTYGNISLSWCITLSTINIYYLPEILEEYYANYSDFGLYLNLVHGPIHYNISKLPEHIKHKVIAKLETIPKEYVSAWHQLPGIIGFIRDGQPEEDVWKEFLSKTKTHDGYRNQLFEVTFKDYSELIT